MHRWIAGIISLCLLTSFASATESSPEMFRSKETPKEQAARMAWWRNAKFGMFVHWGLYAAADGEWKGKKFPDMRPGIEWLMCKGEPGNPKGIDPNEYVAVLAPKMTLKNFNPNQWADLAAGAGMKYFIITAKHHDGFGMVDFPNTDYDIAGQTPYGKDPMIALANAMRQKGLHFGFYFSQSQDWSKPGGRPLWFKGKEGDWNKYVEQHAVPQLHHLLGGTYGPVDILWFDSGSCTKSQEGAAKIWNELSAQPEILVNKRLRFKNMGDFDTPEQWIPSTVQTNAYWETCMTMNGGWGYNPTDTNWKSTNELIQNLCWVVSRGGNYLLNVGPRADGSWPPEVVERLKGIGAWMKINGESIYNTQPTSLPPLRWGSTTWKPTAEGCRLYCQIMHWPKDAALRIPLKNKVRKASFLCDPYAVPVVEKGEDGKIIRLNRSGPIHPAASVLVLDLEGTHPEPLPLVIRQENSGVVRMLAPEAKTVGGLSIASEAPVFKGWNGRKPERRKASWTIRVLQGGRTYRLVANYGFNASTPPEKMAFIVSVNGQEARIPVHITGTEVSPRNKEHNQLIFQDVPAEGTIQLKKPGLYQIELRTEGAPKSFSRPKKSDRNKCYTPFAQLKELRLEPAD